MAMLDAAEVYLQLGDAFVIPKGLNYQWQQSDFVHKIFMGEHQLFYHFPVIHYLRIILVPIQKDLL